MPLAKPIELPLCKFSSDSEFLDFNNAVRTCVLLSIEVSGRNSLGFVGITASIVYSAVPFAFIVPLLLLARPAFAAIVT